MAAITESAAVADTILLEPTRIAPWNSKVQLTFHQCVNHGLPDAVRKDQISCAFVFAFDRKTRMIMGKHVKRGYDIVGGHVEPGEDAVDAAVRELEEEVGIKATSSQLRLFGFERLFDLSDSRPSLKHLWPHGYFLYYILNNVDSDTNVFKPRESTEESEEDMQDCKWFAVEELQQHKWFLERPHVLSALLASLVA